MNTSREKVLELLAAHRITAAEADALLLAMGQRQPSRWSALLNLLERIPSGAAVALTLVPLAVQLFAERHGVQFSGALDVQVKGHSASWSLAVLDLLVSFPLMALVLWTAAWVARRPARPMDILALVGLSRWPLAAVGLLALPLARVGPERLQQLHPLELVLLLAMLPLVAWNLTLLCLGFRTATGLHGGRLAWTFILGVVVAESLSKLLMLLPPVAS